MNQSPLELACYHLSGYGIELVPYSECDIHELFVAAHSADTFKWFPRPFKNWDTVTFQEFWDERLANGINIHGAFANGKLVGSTSIYATDLTNRACEVGYTWYSPSVRGTWVNPACKLLILGHALNTLGAVRVQLKTDKRNLPSQKAMAKCGFTYEGILRNHMILPDGSLRDTVMFSVTPDIWPNVRDTLLALMRERNCPSLSQQDV